MMRILLALLLAARCGAGDVPSDAPVPAPPPAHQGAESLLTPVRTETPRQTMRTFMAAMDRYALAIAAGERLADTWLDDAVRCLDLSRTNPVTREEVGREAAILLKETIDRVIRIDADKVPAEDVERWRLKDTEIVIWRIVEGDRRGEHLFSPDTVERAKFFFNKVQALPLLPGALGGGWNRMWQERYIPVSFKNELFGVAYWQWIMIGGLIFIGLVLRQVARLGAFVLRHLATRSAVAWRDELIATLTGPMTHLFTTGVWFASLHLLGITGAAYSVIAFLIKGAFFINLAYLAYNLAGFLGHRIERGLREKRQDVNQSLFTLLRQALQLLALLFCLLLGAQNMGMDVASLIAGLGIGGLAFALAAKDTLANLFGSIMIMLDRTFRVGDYIVAKGVEGTVEEIGFRSTRIRTVSNSLASIPNNELVMATVDNLGLRKFSHVSTTLSLAYDTPPERLVAFCDGIRAILTAHPAVKQDAIVVAFNAIASSALTVLVDYHLQAAAWKTELEQRQGMLLEVLRLGERLGVAFALPTQTLHVASLPSVAPGEAPTPPLLPASAIPRAGAMP